MSEDQGRITFRDEARDLLAEIEESLLELEGNPDNDEQVARLFRAMHTVKGSGAMFGFDEIARFTHEVETLYDRVRSKSLELTPGLLALTLKAKDHIQNLLVTGDSQLLRERSDELMEQFRLLGGGEAAPSPSREATDNAGPDRADASGKKPACFWIRYRPGPDTFSQGTNPLGLLEELSELGTIRVRFHDDPIAPLESIDPQKACGWWDILLSSDRGENAVKDVFIFVDESEVFVHQVGDLFLRDTDIPALFDLLDSMPGEEPQALALALAVKVSQKTALRGTGVSSKPEPVVAEVQGKAVAAQSASMRVDAGRLDSLVNLVGELVIVQSRLTQAVNSDNRGSLRGIAEELERLASEMRDLALGIRMVPIGSMYGTLRRLVRDLAVSLGKKVEFVGLGAETELDKNVIDRLKDPLVHILRNSIDHGVELPGNRLAAGKPEKGVIELAAGHEGGNVVLTIKDDGAGIDPEKVRQKAVERGLVQPEAQLTRKQAYDLLFQPGFSTAKEVSSVSGRGVGMDVVLKSIESLRGSIAIDSTPGSGSSIAIRLPLTLAIIDGLQFRVGKDFFIIPLHMVEACQERAALWPQKEVDVVEMRGELIPCVSLRRLLDIPGRPPAYERIIIVGLDGGLLGLTVDVVVGQQQAVIKSLSCVYRSVRWVSGTTINGDGGVSLILDVSHLMRIARERQEAQAAT